MGAPSSSLQSMFFLFFLLLPFSIASPSNVTTILAAFPEFSSFNRLLTETRLASEINSRSTITVLALDNPAMDLLSKGSSIYTTKNLLSFHILTDYYGASKIHSLTAGSTRASTLFQASGNAPASSGHVNITNLSKGKVGFAPDDNNGEFSSLFVKSLHEAPYNLSILHISKGLSTLEAAAPAAPPSLNLTDILNKNGCKAFADLLRSSEAISSFDGTVEGGLTVFCPPNSAIKSFEPKYKNLTASGKNSLLLSHGIPIFLPMQTLKTNNGGKSTLASVRGSSYMVTVQTNGTAINIQTPLNSAKITSTLKSENPLAVYMIDKVLMPKELFKPAAAPSPAPAPAPASSTPAPAPDSPDESPLEAAPAPKKNSAFSASVPLLSILLAACSSFLF